MGSFAAHPAFRDVLWDFDCSPEEDGEFLVRVCPSEEALFEAALAGNPGVASWKIPRGIVPTREGRSLPRLGSEAIAEIGQRILTSLPPILRDSLSATAGLPLRLKVSGEGEAIGHLPWECLRAAAVPALVVRSVPLRYPVPPATVSPPLRVLLVTTNPKDERLLNSWEELKVVSPESLPDYQTRVCNRASAQGLREVLVEFQPHVVHYVGHSATTAGQGCLVLHDERNHTYWLGASELASMLPVTVRLLCLSTCFTARNYDLRALALLAHAAPELKLPTTVVNQLPLERDSEGAVHHFWQVFYGEMANSGGDVTSAFARAQREIVGSLDWPSFSLVLRDSTGWPLHVTDGPPIPELAQAEFEALYATSVANYLSQQTSPRTRGRENRLAEISREEAQRADQALSSFGGSRFGTRRRN